MRLLNLFDRSLSSNSKKWRRFFTISLLEKHVVSSTIQARREPFSNTQGTLWRFRTRARFFAHTGSDKLLDLPRSCPGCGAFAQITDPAQAGYYGLTRKAVQGFIAWSRKVQAGLGEKEFGSSLELKHHYPPGKSKNHQG